MPRSVVIALILSMLIPWALAAYAYHEYQNDHEYLNHL